MLKHILMVLLLALPVLGMVPSKPAALRFMQAQGDSIVRVVKCLEYKPGYAYIVVETPDTAGRVVMGIAEVTYPTRTCSDNPTILLVSFFKSSIPLSDTVMTLMPLNNKFWGIALETKGSGYTTIRLYKISDEWQVVWSCFTSNTESITYRPSPDGGSWYAIRATLRDSSGVVVNRTYRYDGIGGQYIPSYGRANL